jgi:hypothetical protein
MASRAARLKLGRARDSAQYPKIHSPGDHICKLPSHEETLRVTRRPLLPAALRLLSERGVVSQNDCSEQCNMPYPAAVSQLSASLHNRFPVMHTQLLINRLPQPAVFLTKIKDRRKLTPKP